MCIRDSHLPTHLPTNAPSATPTAAGTPTIAPTLSPTEIPTQAPAAWPTPAPTTQSPTPVPAGDPSVTLQGGMSIVGLPAETEPHHLIQALSQYLQRPSLDPQGTPQIAVNRTSGSEYPVEFRITNVDPGRATTLRELLSYLHLQDGRFVAILRALLACQNGCPMTVDRATVMTIEADDNEANSEGGGLPWTFLSSAIVAGVLGCLLVTILCWYCSQRSGARVSPDGEDNNVVRIQVQIGGSGGVDPKDPNWHSSTNNNNKGGYPDLEALPRPRRASAKEFSHESLLEDDVVDDVPPPPASIRLAPVRHRRESVHLDHQISTSTPVKSAVSRPGDNQEVVALKAKVEDLEAEVRRLQGLLVASRRCGDGKEEGLQRELDAALARVMQEHASSANALEAAQKLAAHERRTALEARLAARRTGVAGDFYTLAKPPVPFK
eukprot:TRINITY_DN6217_c0_g1_i8.p1 TRINITY_DN6217_c0_g1~~TRINITY_DN6217_c0_g1_i8.p1  ORF type:complete len:437 (-),score=93.28 TRINITY_DN6217_c0_g1_i8:88-1398(-)